LIILRTAVYFFLTAILLAGENPRPKNIIILIGDGMGVDAVTATVLTHSNSPYKRFKSIGFSLTSSANNLITESAAGATALATGYKTKSYLVSVDSLSQPLYTFFELAMDKSKSAGIVVTSSVSHATPGAFYAHVNDRKNEYEIALQLASKNLDVVIGGGREYFLPENLGGSRKDNRDLISEMKNHGYKYFESTDELLSSNSDEKILALLSFNGFPSADERIFSLAELTQKAIDKLYTDEDGFVLMIEGSQIDWFAHDNNTEKLLTELEDFNSAINTCLDFAESSGNTLVIVTADHETGGVAVTSGNKDGSNLVLSYTGRGHTAAMVPIFAFGPGEENFQGIMENFNLSRIIFQLIDPFYTFPE
jgi:alkaline phosphatase